MDSSILYWTTVLLVILTLSSDAQFISSEDEAKTKCSGESVDFNWTYINSASVLFVEWKVNTSRIALENIGGSQPFSPSAGYIGRLTKISNAQISLGSLTTSDVGTYICEANYNDGTTPKSHKINLSVHDLLNKTIKIETTTGNGKAELSASFFHASIIYTWKLTDSVIGIGFSITVTKNGNYTLCISGGIADCRDPSMSPCTSTEVEGLSSCGTDGELFMCGFSFFPIELVVFIVILILLKLEKIGGFTKVKIAVSCVFLIVALIIGISLGVAHKECSEKNLFLGLSIVFGCLLAAAHFVIICLIHKKLDSKKDDKDKERQGTPVSASNIRVTSEKAPSHGNPASKNGNVIVSLPNEPIRPLPVPPATRKNQLEPLSVENDGATSPEKKKKKKKKKKRKNTESTDAPEES